MTAAISLKVPSPSRSISCVCNNRLNSQFEAVNLLGTDLDDESNPIALSQIRQTITEQLGVNPEL